MTFRRSPDFPLDDHIARCRMLYPSPLLSAPSVMVIDVPPESRGEGLALGRYYPIVLETEIELHELDRLLKETHRQAFPPSLLDGRPSQFQTSAILISRYNPPQPGWPWLSVICWPQEYSRVAEAAGVRLARKSYTMELFSSEEHLDDHHFSLVGRLGSQCEISIRLLSADRLIPGGTA